MTRVKHVQGNTFRLGIPLVKRIIQFSGGLRSRNDESLSPLLEGAPITVIFGRGGAVRHERMASLDNDGYVVVEDKGKLPIGFYNVTVLATDSNGDPLRYKDNFVLRIVDTTAEADYSELEGYDGYFKFPILASRGEHQSLINITDNAVKITEGTGFDGEITDSAVKLYARYGQSKTEITNDAVKLTII